MSLTENLIELIENKNIEERDLEKAKWFLLDSIANIVAGRNTKPGKSCCICKNCGGYRTTIGVPKTRQRDDFRN